MVEHVPILVHADVGCAAASLLDKRRRAGPGSVTFCPHTYHLPEDTTALFQDILGHKLHINAHYYTPVPPYPPRAPL